VFSFLRPLAINCTGWCVGEMRACFLWVEINRLEFGSHNPSLNPHHQESSPYLHHIEFILRPHGGPQCKLQQTLGFRPFCRNLHGAASVTIGPLLPFTSTSACCSAARRSGHRCMMQHFGRLKCRCVDKADRLGKEPCQVCIWIKMRIFCNIHAAKQCCWSLFDKRDA
jgi:hypothetical protein